MIAPIRLLENAVFEPQPIRWKIGVVALATDSVLEGDFAAMSPSREVGIYVSRVKFANPTTRENLLAMAPRLSEAAGLLLPEQDIDVIAYGCTSGTALIGHDAVAASIREAKPGVAVVTPSRAASIALKTLKANKIAMLTPYIEPVTRGLVECLESDGFEILAPCCLGLEDDGDIARVAPESLFEIAVDICPPEAEALFLSCTALRAIGIIERLEERLGIPVLSSNQVMFWQSLREAGCSMPVSGFGTIFQTTPA